MKRTTITASLVATLAIIAALALAGCATAQADAPEEKPAAEFAYVHDWAEPKEPNGMVRIKKEMDARAAESQSEAPIAEQADSQPEYWDVTAYSGPYDPELDNNPAYIGGGDGFAQQGVREFNGREERWYSSNVLYHKDTAQWTVDEEGYYRDDKGRYVVAVSDDELKDEETGLHYQHGDEIETSKGTGIILDSGCEVGTTDFYVSW